MRILVLNGDYPAFLRWFYEQHPNLRGASYAEQLAARNASLFGHADFYSKNFNALGHEAQEIHFNNPWLQNAWAREHGMLARMATENRTFARAEGFTMKIKRALRPYHAQMAPVASTLGLLHYTLGSAQTQILLAQIEHIQPDVVLNQDMHAITAKVLTQMRKPRRLLIGQCGIDPPSASALKEYDFAVSILPWVVDTFRQGGAKAKLVRLAFETTILDQLGPQPKRDIPVSFIGSLGSDHGQRLRFLETIAAHFPLSVWMPSTEGIPANSPLRQCYRGQAWGTDMYEILRRSKITLNAHVGIARGQAANMRLYEATGVGTLLLTDNLSDLNAIFKPGREVITYDDPVNCVAKITHFLDAGAERKLIATAGQKRTLTHHTYRQRAEELLAHISTFLDQATTLSAS